MIIIMIIIIIKLHWLQKEDIHKDRATYQEQSKIKNRSLNGRFIMIAAVTIFIIYNAVWSYP